MELRQAQLNTAAAYEAGRARGRGDEGTSGGA